MKNGVVIMKLTTAQILIEFQLAHGDFYNYQLVDYQGAHKKVRILCPVHGEFKQAAREHKKGKGCPKCGNEKIGNKLRATSLSVINDFNKVHGDFYDYSQVEYHSTHKKVKIICPLHGEFFQTPSLHKSGGGCSECYNAKRSEVQMHPLSDVLATFKVMHGDLYDYSLVDYKGNNTKIDIICREHGVFKQVVASHKSGCGCPRCYADSRSSGLILEWTTVLADFTAIHGGRYDYSESIYSYVNNKSKISIICPVHGRFSQVVSSHKSGYGCKKCATKFSADERRLNTKEVVNGLKDVHGDRYDYSKVDYTGAKEKIVITCLKHGDFTQTVSEHKRSYGCPRCGYEVTADKLRFDTQSVITEFKEAHGEKYDYSLVEYTGAIENVKIICPDHGAFEQTPHSHKSGKGCSSCAEYGFRRYKPAILYLLELPEYGYYKIGVTNRTVEERFMGDMHHLKVIRIIEFSVGIDAWNLERKILSSYRSVEGFNVLISGNTEVLYDLPDLDKYLEK